MQVINKGVEVEWDQQLLKYKMQMTDKQSTWTLNLTRRLTTVCTVISLRQEWSNYLMIPVRLRLFRNLAKTKKSDLVELVKHDWLSAAEIASLAGVPHKCAVKLLVNMALCGDIETTTAEWADEKFRQRKRRLYRRPRISDAERANLLNACFGFKPVEVSHAHARQFILRG